MEFVHEILENQTDYSKVAIIQQKRSITYKQLNDSSVILANMLNSLAGDTKQRVIILLDKSIEYIISYFGVMKTGSCFIPVDVSLPDHRLNYIIQNSGANIVITNTHFKEKYASVIKDMSLVLLDDFQQMLVTYEELPEFKKLNMRNKQTRDDLAYIIYTSGSTGAPKGVKICHKSFLAFVESVLADIPYYNSDCRYLSVFPYYFDAAWVDVFPTLYKGGTLVLFNKLMSANQLLKALSDNKITMTCMPSTMIKLITSKYASLDNYDLCNLQLLWYGTEACPVKHVRYLHNKYPHIKFLHSYGPTECTCTSHMYYCKEEDFEKDIDVFPIGKELKTIESFALNDAGDKINTGEIGELYIAGIQVMEGYVSDDIKTKEVLSYSKEDGKTIYRTGDYVTIDEKGNYIFVGRRDDMVKANGKLVYMSEIEKVINELDTVVESIVTSYRDDMEMMHLKAYVITSGACDIDSITIKNYITNKLPQYMVPNKYILLAEKEVPKTHSMKIDRNKLLEKQS